MRFWQDYDGRLKVTDHHRPVACPDFTIRGRLYLWPRRRAEDHWKLVGLT